MTDGLVFYTHPMSRGRIVRWVGVRSIRDVQRRAKFDSDPDVYSKFDSDPDVLRFLPGPEPSRIPTAPSPSTARTPAGPERRQ